MRLFLFFCAAAMLVSLGSCGTRDERELDESTLAGIRAMLDTRRCARNMDDLMFAIVFAVLGEDSTAVYAVPAGIPESLFACPVSGLSYEVLVDSTRVSISCPSGHGVREEELP